MTSNDFIKVLKDLGCWEEFKYNSYATGSKRLIADIKAAFLWSSSKEAIEEPYDGFFYWWEVDDIIEHVKDFLSKDYSNGKER